MAEINARKQIIDKISSADNILITVSSNPSVDELAAALALTIAINKSGKRATAVASGQMPDALKFLRPEKTFENSVDSLRDFIIALSKDKADHLRYKLVGDYVKIFITPYKTTITENDLEFEQGDFNVDLVVALGVQNKDSLDSALAAHGRILHDATVGVITVGNNSSDLSSLNWHIDSASSLSEVVLDVISSLGKDALTKPVATALLTGIVAETERFSNQKTSAKVMNIASKLMMAGADQQLVATKLAEAAEKEAGEEQSDFSETSLVEAMPKQPESKPTVKKANDGSLSISHDEDPEDEEVDDILSEEENEINDAVASEAENQEVQTPTEHELTAEEELDNSLNDLNAAAQQPQALDLLDDFSDQNKNIAQAPVAIEEESPTQIEAEPVQPAQTFEQPLPEVNPPIQNYAPSVPEETEPLAADNAFISEAPVVAQNFEPATAQMPQISTHNAAPHFDEPQAEPTDSYQNGEASQESAIPSEDNTYIRPQTATEITEEPSMGGTLNATTDQAAEDARRAFEDEHNKTILTHGNAGSQAQQPNYNSIQNPAQQYPQQDYNPQTDTPTEQLSQNPVDTQAQPSGPVDYDPSQMPAVDFGGFPPPPPVPDFSQMPMPPELPQVPEFNAQNFAQNQNYDSALGSDASSANVIPDEVYPSDPSQFKIPGM